MATRVLLLTKVKVGCVITKMRMNGRLIGRLLADEAEAQQVLHRDGAEGRTLKNGVGMFIILNLYDFAILLYAR
jgi:hypothetical protein